MELVATDPSSQRSIVQIWLHCQDGRCANRDHFRPRPERRTWRCNTSSQKFPTFKKMMKLWLPRSRLQLRTSTLERIPQNLQVFVFREFGGNRQNLPGVATNRRLLPEGEGIADGLTKYPVSTRGWKGLTLKQGLDTNDSWVFGLTGRLQAFFKSFASWIAPCSREAASPGKPHESALERWMK